MNSKLFKKLNESLSNPVVKDNIVITEAYENAFIFGKKYNDILSLTESSYYTFGLDAYKEYIKQQNEKQEKFDKRNLSRSEKDHAKREKKKQDALEMKKIKAENKIEYLRIKRDERLEKLKLNLEKEKEISTSLSEKNDVLSMYKKEYFYLNHNLELQDLAIEAEAAIEKKDKEKAKECYTKVKRYIDGLDAINRDPHFSILRSSDKKDELTTFPNKLLSKLKGVM